MKSTYVDESKLSSNMYNELDDVINDSKNNTSVSRSYSDRKIRILIYHTHTTEAFKPEIGRAHV